MDRYEFEAAARYCGSSEYFEEQNWHRVRLIGGSSVYLAADDQSVTPHVVQDFYWESWISTWMINELTEGNYETFIDVGANGGYFSVLADPYVNRVMMFEANPNLFAALDMTAFGLNSKATVVCNAAWDKAGETLDIRIPGDLIGSATVVDSVDLSTYPVDVIKVGTTTVDREVHALRLDGKMMIKIDVESAEEKVWHGMTETLEKFKPTVLLEYTPGAYSDKFLSTLREYGTIRRIAFDGYEYLVSDEEILNSGDWEMLVIRPKG